MQRRVPKYSLLLALAGALAVAACYPKPTIQITSPAHGAFLTSADVTVTGAVTDVSPGVVFVRVNGNVTAVNPDLTWSITLPLDTANVVNPIFAQLVRSNDGVVLARERIVVEAGDSIADGGYSPQGVGLRLNDSGLDQIEPLIQGQVDLDLATLLPVGTVLINNQCMIDGGIFGCWGRATVTVSNPPPSISGFSLNVDSQTNYVNGNVTVNDVQVDVYISGSGLVPSCGLRLTATTTNLPGNYELKPDTVDPSNIDVNLLGDIGVSFSGFSQEYTSGVCDDPIIGDIIQLFIGSVQDDVTTGLRNFLRDPDGTGPQDSVLADAFETALAGISITGPIGEALQVNLESPLYDVYEDTNGITLDSDVRVQSSVGTGPGQCQPPEGAPDLAASYHVAEAFPAFGGTTPVQGLPYDLGLSISTSAFNQLLKAQTECGLLRTAITELDLGTGTIPLTAGTLALLIPQFSYFSPSMPMRIELTPTLAPFLTGSSGPGGELGEVRIGQYVADVIGTPGQGSEIKALSGAIDFRAGLDMSFDNATGSLVVGIGTVTPQDITVAILDNPINTDEASLSTALPNLLAFVLPQLGEGLGAFPIPSFLGLQLQSVEVSRSGQFYSLFTDLTPAP